MEICGSSRYLRREAQLDRVSGRVNDGDSREYHGQASTDAEG
jgi:hypothetical protein